MTEGTIIIKWEHSISEGGRYAFVEVLDRRAI